jgi:hypothetical protein
MKTQLQAQSKAGWLLGLVLMGAVALTSCEEKSTYKDVQELANVTSDNNNAEQESDAVNDFVSVGMEDQGVSKTEVVRYRKIPAGATVTFSNTGGVYSLSINFGTVGLACYDGRTRKGIITATANGFYRQAGTVITTNTDGYAVSRNGTDFVGHDFNRVVTNKGTNQAGNIVFSIVETDQLLYNGGQVVKWNSNREREWINGTDDIYLTNDDSYSITGNGTAERVGVRTIDYTIDSPLIFRFNCGVVYGGILRIEDRDSGNNIIVDYGSGCTVAKTVTYNIDGKSYTLFL